MKAVDLKFVDLHYRLHAQAYLNVSANAKKKSGKNRLRPVYNKFKKFFDYEDEERRVMEQSEHQKQGKNRYNGIGKFLRRGATKDGE